jgi:hypothetical protein
MDNNKLRKLIENASYRSKGRGENNQYDCWGWVIELSKELFNNDLESYLEKYKHSTDRSVFDVIIEETKKYTPVKLGQEKPGDLLALRIKGEPFHTAIIIKKGVMSHIASNINACIEKYNTPMWRTKIDGIYRP